MRWTLPLAALVVAFAAHAGDAPPAPPPGRHSIDANGDGIVTREEAQSNARLAGMFDSVDTNKDGQLDSAEMRAHREAMHAQMREHAQERWQAADKDGDGALSREEAQASMPRMAERFGQFDANSDGKISREEMHEFRMRKRDRMGPSE